MKIDKQMKKTTLILSVLAFFCLSSGQAAEAYGKVIPAPADVAPLVQSAANAEGNVVELFLRRDINATVLALRQQDGSRRFLYHRNPVGTYPAGPETATEVHWLTPDSFVCVAAGRLKSFYTLYRLSPMDDVPGTMFVWKDAEGCVHFRVEWQAQEGRLIGSWKGKPYLTILPFSVLSRDDK